MAGHLGRALVCGGLVVAMGCGSHIKLGDDGGISNAGRPVSDAGNAGAFFGGGGGGNFAGGGVGSMAGNWTLNSCDGADQDNESWIAFDSDRDLDRELYRMHPDGSELERLTDSVGVDREPAFSPDGASLAFSSTRSGKLQIHLLDLASRDVTQVTSRDEGADQASFSHDGKRLAFHSGKSVYTIGVDGSDEQLVASGDDDFNAYFWPKFSLDDRQLIFDRNNEINVADLDGGGFRQIVANSATTIKAPALSPAGDVIAYEVYCEMGPSIWLSEVAVKTDPCKGTLVSLLYQQAFHPSWGGTRFIAYHLVDEPTNVAQLAIVSRRRGSASCKLTDGSGDDRNPSWYMPAGE